MKIETQVIIDKIDELLKEGHKPFYYLSRNEHGCKIDDIKTYSMFGEKTCVYIHDVFIETESPSKIKKYIEDILQKNQEEEFERKQKQNETKVKHYFGI